MESKILEIGGIQSSQACGTHSGFKSRSSSHCGSQCPLDMLLISTSLHSSMTMESPSMRLGVLPLLALIRHGLVCTTNPDRLSSLTWAFLVVLQQSHLGKASLACWDNTRVDKPRLRTSQIEFACSTLTCVAVERWSWLANLVLSDLVVKFSLWVFNKKQPRPIQVWALVTRRHLMS